MVLAVLCKLRAKALIPPVFLACNRAGGHQVDGAAEPGF